MPRGAMMKRHVRRWAAALPVIAAGCDPDTVDAQASLANATMAVGSVRVSNLRIEVSLDDRVLMVLAGTDTLRAAPIAVASGRELRFRDRRWKFETPIGRRTILAKRVNPVWRPPDWHYAEEALQRGLDMRPLPDTGLALADGRRVQLRGDRVSVQLDRGGPWFPMPEDEHIIFDSTLYIPPFGSRNREVPGELGAFALDLGDGYLVHGTPDQESVGSAVTHGCLRLLDDDIAWLFEHVPVGTGVVIRQGSARVQAGR